MTDIILGKEQFLIDHNKLSPEHLQATFALLTQFQEQRKPLLKDADWSFKLRIPLIIWLETLPPVKRKHLKEPIKQEYNIYPEPE